MPNTSHGGRDDSARVNVEATRPLQEDPDFVPPDRPREGLRCDLPGLLPPPALLLDLDGLRPAFADLLPLFAGRLVLLLMRGPLDLDPPAEPLAGLLADLLGLLLGFDLGVDVLRFVFVISPSQA